MYYNTFEGGFSGHNFYRIGSGLVYNYVYNYFRGKLSRLFPDSFPAIIYREAGYSRVRQLWNEKMEVEKMEGYRKEKDEEKIIQLADFVEYQDGSVVSKEVIKKEAGTVTLFAFGEGQGLSEHTAPFDALVYVIDGEAEIVISKEKYMLQKGEMIIMPANQPHALKAVKKFKMMLVMIKSSR